MDASDQALIKALRRLTIAVWALVVLGAAFFAVAAVTLAPAFWLPSRSFESTSSPRSRATLPSVEHENFYALPLDKQLGAASVIAIARYQKEGDKLRCVISEILKRSPDTEFYFNPGDEYPQCSRFPKSNENYGDGQLMFFVGNPADFRYSMSFFGDRLTGLGDMPLELLRSKIRASSK